MKNTNEEIADWLRDAHALKSNLVRMLESQVERLAGYPELQQNMADHAEESRRHATLVETALESLGEDTSTLKDGMAKLAGMVSPLGVGMASDAPVKIVLANYAAEQFEIACYISLQTACETAGLSDIAATCGQILTEEVKMADILMRVIPGITQAHLGTDGLP